MDWYSFALGLGFGFFLALILISSCLLEALRQASDAYKRANRIQEQTIELLEADE